MRPALLLGSLALLQAQSPSPHTKPSDYPVHAQLDTVTIAAEYLVHSLPTSQGVLLANDYLVVEVAFFGPPLSRLQVSPDSFTLRVNGRRDALATQRSGIVTQSFAFPLGPNQQSDSLQARLQAASLPEGEKPLPLSGLIYFPFHGKLKTIHSLDLIYDGAMGKTTLKLVP